MRGIVAMSENRRQRRFMARIRVKIHKSSTKSPRRSEKYVSTVGNGRCRTKRHIKNVQNLLRAANRIRRAKTPRQAPTTERAQSPPPIAAAADQEREEVEDQMEPQTSIDRASTEISEEDRYLTILLNYTITNATSKTIYKPTTYYELINSEPELFGTETGYKLRNKVTLMARGHSLSETFRSNNKNNLDKLSAMYKRYMSKR